MMAVSPTYAREDHRTAVAPTLKVCCNSVTEGRRRTERRTKIQPDGLIVIRYTRDTLEEAKIRQLQIAMGQKADDSAAAVVSRLTSQKGLDLVLKPYLSSEQGGSWRLLGAGDPGAAGRFRGSGIPARWARLGLAITKHFRIALRAARMSSQPSRFEPCGFNAPRSGARTLSQCGAPVGLLIRSTALLRTLRWRRQWVCLEDSSSVAVTG